MIHYSAASGSVWSSCQLAGSVFPKAMLFALPCSLIAAALTAGANSGYLEFLEDEESVLKDNTAWSGFSFLVGFLIVFRTSQSYNRFWDGCTSIHNMRAEWFDACSSLIAFCRHSRISEELMVSFQNRLVRLFSMLHAAALAEIEDSCNKDIDAEAFKFELIDPQGLDEKSLRVVKNSTAKAELIFQWIQQLIVDGSSTGVLSIPAPILSRSFHELSNGMVAFQDAMKISVVPFPFPYAQTCDFLLVLHWIIAPFVVCRSVSQPVWAGIFVFTQAFVLWSLNIIAVQLQNPFGMDPNDIDGRDMQVEMNSHLLLLLSESTLRVPTLSKRAVDLRGVDARTFHLDQQISKSFREVWQEQSGSDGQIAHRFTVARSPTRSARFLSRNAQGVTKVFSTTRSSKAFSNARSSFSNYDNVLSVPYSISESCHQSGSYDCLDSVQVTSVSNAAYSDAEMGNAARKARFTESSVSSRVENIEKGHHPESSGVTAFESHKVHDLCDVIPSTSSQQESWHEPSHLLRL